MDSTRRLFLRQTAMAGSFALTLWLDRDLFGDQCGLPKSPQDCQLPSPDNPKQFVPSELFIRTRHSAREMADPSFATQLQTFRDAICKVRNLSADNLVSWTKFVAQHCISCARTNTNNIHYDWQFLPWHRAMLYFLERTMRSLQKDQTVSLVYWDWENPASRVLPTIYAPADQPLYWANRTLTGPAWPLPDDAVDVQPLLAIPHFSTFGGTSVQKSPVPATYSGPHANVHNAFNPGDMANLQYSPRDPVFYAHHGNIDRLWSSWVAAGHDNPEFGQSRVTFYDEDQQLRYILLNDLRETGPLGYQYSTLMQPVARASSLERFSMRRDAAHTFTLESPLMGKLAESEAEFLILTNIRNLEQFAPDTRRYGVFSRQVPVGTAATVANGFLGMVSRVLSEGHAHAEPLSAALNVSGELAAPGASQERSLSLFVAPLDASMKTTAAAIPLVADEVSIVG